MRFVASADWQLGMTAHFLTDEARPRFAQARIDVIRQIGVVAAEHDAAFVLVCGDVFESNQLDRAIVARAFDAMREISVPVYLLPGNHDPLDAASIYRSTAFVAGKPDHVHVLDTPGVHDVGGGVEIVAAPWFSKRPLADLVAAALDGLEPAADGVVRVVAGHGTTLGIDRDNPASIHEESLAVALDDGRADVVVLGDRHSTTRVSDRIWYPGAPEVTSRRETHPGNVLVIDVTDTAVVLDEVAVGTWFFVQHQAHVDSRDDVEALAAWLAEQPAKDRTAVWLKLVGTLSIGAKARLDDVIDHAGDLYALVRLWERHTELAVLPEDGEFADLGHAGFAQDAIAELVALLGTDSDVEARDALGLLYRLSGGAR
ncbi:exonuclease SbcCD subunit D [soil metagenome]